MPAKLGRLPNLIGKPAGGSLTADQWLTFATVVAPLAVNSFCPLGNMAPNDQSRYPKFGRITWGMTLTPPLNIVSIQLLLPLLQSARLLLQLWLQERLLRNRLLLHKCLLRIKHQTYIHE